MNVKDFTHLLRHPDKVVSPVQTNQLEEVLKVYPYFQAARAVHLKGLKNLNSFKYNDALKVTAAYTTDRDVLFDYITSREFLQHAIAATISGQDTTDYTADTAKKDPNTQHPALIEASEDGPLPQNEEEASAILDPGLFTAKNVDERKSNAAGDQELLDIGEPLPFTRKERYSFAEWLQLTSLKKVKRGKNTLPEIEPIAFPLEEAVLKNKKFDLIDKFIATSPKIVPKEDPVKIDISDSVKIDKKELMTVTLAKVYLEQKKYKKAIQAYKILSLKYPEKSSFFADRIEAIEKLKQEHK